ncbi:uracil-DNA glycosylase [Pseudogemmobacter sonorensis]|uniref:uracil-DNA glycosylase n=1 Tax=Pseudogemmobacter sonorensis TaxID=2989681 RepID=UPI00369C36E1
MGIAEDIAGPDGWEAALAALAWQLDCGVTEALSDLPVNRYEAAPPPPLPEARPARAAPQGGPSGDRPGDRQAAPAYAPAPAAVDAVAVARGMAARAATLDDLREAVHGFDLCELKKGARNTVFCDGNPRARVLVLGEAPGREEDLEGRPFVGEAGRLLDRMFAAIGLSRTSPDAERALYITNVMFWRPPGNRDPSPEEIAMMRPFVARHIELADPEAVVVMGNTPLDALCGRRGILRARGNWVEALGKPVLPMTHPAYLLRNPLAKRDAWSDLLSLKARLDGGAG